MSDKPVRAVIQTLSGGGFNKDRLRFFIYGESGSGKTVAASTFPRPLFLDLEDGMASVTRDVDSIRITTWEELYSALDFVVNEDHEYQTVILDSLNEVQALFLKYVVEAYPAVKRSYKALPGMSDYGFMISEVDSVVRVLKALPIHVVFLAQVRAREYDTDMVMPQLIGKNSSQNICRLMDIVGYLYKQEANGSTTRHAAFDVTNFVTKDRSGRLPPIVEIRSRDSFYEDVTQFWKD